MKIEEPKFRCGKNWQEIATLFNYIIKDCDQDWTYTIIEPHRIDEYIAAYGTIITNNDTKFSLMEMIIQSLTEQATDELLNDKWTKVENILEKDFILHQYTIYYWCCWDNNDIEDCWRITPKMREFWLEK